MITQAQVVAPQAQAMAAQANRDVGPHFQKKSSIMALRLRDITKMNPLMFFELKVNKDPKTLLMRSTRFYML